MLVYASSLSWAMLSCQRLFIPNKRFVWISFTPTSVSPISRCLRYVCHTPRASVPPIQAISCAHRSLNSPLGTSAPMVTPLRKRTDGMQIDSTIRDGASPKRSTIIAKFQTQYGLTVRKKVDKRSSGAHQGLAKANKHPTVPLLILRSCQIVNVTTGSSQLTIPRPL